MNLPQPFWCKPETNLNLLNNEIHIWCSTLEPNLTQIARLQNILSAEEVKRAKRYKFPHLQNNFILARATLRILLSKYLNLAPSAIKFSYSHRGKPYLSLPEKLEFNLSHSGNLVLYAICKNSSIGIDVEYLRPLQNLEKIARRFFSLSESNYLQQLSPKDRQVAFFQLWTAKEAYLKATGEGLSDALNTTIFQINHHRVVKFAYNQGQKSQLEDWFFHNFQPQPAYNATVAVQRANTCIKYWQTEQLLEIE